MSKTENRFKPPSRVKRPFYFFILLTLKIPVRHIFKLQAINSSVIPRVGGAILVSNHINLFDPIWIYDVVKRPVYFVATEELFRGKLLGSIVRAFGAFPKRKATQDFKAVRNIVGVLKMGGMIGLFAEGIRTWDGTNSPIIPTIARLIKRLNVPVYACRFEGGYLSFPRWADKWRRMPVKVYFSELYKKDNMPDSEEQIVEGISREIKIRDYEADIEVPKRRVPGLAAGLPKIIYRCPVCKTIEGLVVVQPLSANRVECKSCFTNWEVDIRGRLTPVDEAGEKIGTKRTIAEVYRQIKEMPFTAIENGYSDLEEQEHLYMMSRMQALYHEGGFPNFKLISFGRLYLTSKRLIFADRNGVLFAAGLDKVDSFSIEPGDKMHFAIGGILHRIPFKNESPLKWYDALLRFQKSETLK